MVDREKVLRGLECCAREDIGDCDNCPYESINGPHCDIEMMRDAIALLKDRVADYEAWAREIGVHTCATCSRRDCDCPIENQYSLPSDGYCHLWEGWAKECDF